VILERTPYNKCGESRSEFSTARPRAARRSDIARHICRRGYVVVMQYCRGKFGSGGTFHKYVDEARDGSDLVAWLREQPWCDPGRIGSLGFSYVAHVQSALATMRPRGLACMYIDSGGFSSAYEMKQVTWAHKHALRAARRRGDEGMVRALTERDIHEWFRDLPWSRGRSPLTPVPDYESYLFDEWQEGTFSEYYRRPGMNNEGYYDMFGHDGRVTLSSLVSYVVGRFLECVMLYVDVIR
jgi:putative CocE/NonD family hydrolase